MAIKFVDDLEFEGKRVFLRADLNVPITEDGTVGDDTRITAVLPTIKYILRKGGRLIIASHLGRPTGERDDRFSLEPVGLALAEMLDKDVILAPDVVSDGTKVMANQLKEGEVMLLENVRFNPGEKKNDTAFAKALASMADVYVNDAFGTCHRAHASVVGVPSLVMEKGAGMLIRKELRYLKLVTEDPDKPFMAILGGAKVSDKLGVIQNLLTKVNMICIGGGMAYTFLAKKGVRVGNSLVDNSKLTLAGEIMDEAARKGVEIILPVDHVVAEKPEAGSVSRNVSNDQGIDDGLAGFDIGIETVGLFEQAIAKAATIVWNGPMGVFEVDKFSSGTMAIAEAVGAAPALSVIGGGDSVSAVRKAGVAEQITHISTGGGASLELLEGKVLPGIKALEQ